MRKSSVIKKTITKASKPTKKESSKQVVQRLEKNKQPTIRSRSKVHLKGKTSRSKSPATKKEEPLFLRDPKAYNKILELPVYEPTREEFKEPLLLIRKLCEKGFDKYGCVKIRPPSSWDPEFSFNRPDKKLSTRKQNLRDLVKGKNFEQNINAYTAEEFKDMADTFAEEYKYKAPFNFANKWRKNEYEFWGLVEDPQYNRQKVSVEYAADLPTRKYGSAFPTVYKAKATDGLSVRDEKTHPFNLNNINHAKDSLFQFITTKTENISGITSPWIYFGMLFASFCWHVEDLYMYSINYMHQGAPKTWYCIPPEYKEDFDEIIREKYADLFAKQPGIMYNIVLTMNPLELIERKIPVYRTEQGPKEFIVTFPKAYHAGFSHGYNTSEAVNIATIDWIQYARMAVNDYTKDGSFKKGSFPYEWLIMENMKRVKDFTFTRESKELLLKEFEDIKRKEFQVRKTIQEIYPKVLIRPFDDTLNRHDAHICMTCKDYPYLSFITCMVCNRKVCTNHVTLCNCVGATVILNIRFSEEDLDEFSQQLKSALPKTRSRRGD